MCGILSITLYSSRFGDPLGGLRKMGSLIQRGWENLWRSPIRTPAESVKNGQPLRLKDMYAGLVGRGPELFSLLMSLVANGVECLSNRIIRAVYVRKLSRLEFTLRLGASVC